MESTTTPSQSKMISMWRSGKGCETGANGWRIASPAPDDDCEGRARRLRQRAAIEGFVRSRSLGRTVPGLFALVESPHNLPYKIASPRLGRSGTSLPRKRRPRPAAWAVVVHEQAVRRGLVLPSLCIQNRDLKTSAFHAMACTQVSCKAFPSCPEYPVCKPSLPNLPV